MSTEEAALSRKAKKAQRDAERKKAGRKRKREEHDEGEAEKAAGGQDELKDDFIPLAGGEETTIARTEAELTQKQKQKKRKRGSVEDGQQSKLESTVTEAAPKLKKRRKSSVGDGEAVVAASDGENAEAAAASNAKGDKNRFILFIGNLPYSATDASITAHFKRIQPFTLRHRVDPKTKKSKGFAFLEFEGYDRMKTCLKVYHHSTFDPDAGAGKEDAGVEEGKSSKKKKDKSRRINVELTAGGGGKGEDRKEKIRAKNVKLEEERKRRREAEEKAAVRREKKGKGKEKATGANAAVEEKGGETQGGESMQGVHPARLARMKT